MLAPTGPLGEDLQSLAERLDGLSACVVLDGLEQLRGPNLDAVDDLLAELQLLTSDTQFVVTSQVDLARTRCEERLRIGGLDEDAGRDVLRALIAAQVPLNFESENRLLGFCEGHPLALRLTAALAVHFGSGVAALQRILQCGAATVELQKRLKQDRRTSLGVCLGLAYDALDADEQRLLFLLANAPSGLFVHHLDANDCGFDASVAAAGLSRWSLIQRSEPGGGLERLHVLAPIASYAERRWRDENAKDVAQLLIALCRTFALIAAVIEARADDPTDIPYMLSRYTEELPNFLRVFDIAERYPENAELALHTAGLCTSLMRFFFILRLPEQGAAVMQRGAEIALRDGEVRRAAGLIVQMVALARRSDNESLANAAEALVDRLDRCVPILEMKGYIILCRAMIASRRASSDECTRLAKEAIGLFEGTLRDRVASTEHTLDDTTDEGHNYLSSAYALLGDALLAKGEPEGAKEAYQAARDLLRGGAVAVNVGQYLHQIGNCESQLGRHAEAARCYCEATIHFHAVAMKEYHSNALCELGFTLTDLGIDARQPDLADDLLIEGLEDVAQDVCRAFTAVPMPHERCASALRKLFGVIVVVSLTTQARALGALSDHLSKLLQPTDAGAAMPSPADRSESFAYVQLANILELADTIGSLDGCSFTDREIELLTMRCFQQGTWIDLRRRSLVWLEIYLRVKCAITDVTVDDLVRASLIAQSGGKFRVRSH
jgi:tetratricopeptide (TPR) repeat protein